MAFSIDDNSYFMTDCGVCTRNFAGLFQDERGREAERNNLWESKKCLAVVCTAWSA